MAEQERLEFHMRPAQEPGIAVAAGAPRRYVMAELLPKDPESKGLEQQNTVAVAAVVVVQENTVAAAAVVVPEPRKGPEGGLVGRQRKDRRKLVMWSKPMSEEEQRNWSSEQLEEPEHPTEKLGVAGAAGEPQILHRGWMVVSPLPTAVAEEVAHIAGAANTETAVLGYQQLQPEEQQDLLPWR